MYTHGGSMDQLAILGGKKIFDCSFQEEWKRPKDLEKKNLAELIDRDELSSSGFGVSKDFENAFASYIGCQYCLGFSHGTAALMAAYYALGVGPGDEIITPAVGYIASYSGALHLGARPIFCDIDPNTLLIDPDSVRKKITSHTKAINLIHLNGRICNLDALISISDEFGIPIIDDASHAHGAEWEGKKLGNFDHITCFSLQGINPRGKPVSGGEGGVACTNSRDYYQKMLAYCHLHRKGIKEALVGSPFQELDNEVLGLKWRPHPFAYVLAQISLSSLDYRNAKRQENYLRTIDCLKEFDFISIPTSYSKAKMAGFYGGLKFIYESSPVNDIPLSLIVRCLEAEGVPISWSGTGSGWSGIGYLEYRRFLFSHGFDLWGHQRGPIDGPWAGLNHYQKCTKADYPIAEQMVQKVFTLPSFIEINPDYFAKLNASFRKLQENQRYLKTQ